jgi:hypothetical protein
VLGAHLADTRARLRSFLPFSVRGPPR